MKLKLNKKRLVIVVIIALLALAYYAVSGRLANSSSAVTNGDVSGITLLDPETLGIPEGGLEILPQLQPDEPLQPILPIQPAEPEAVFEEEAYIPEDGSYTTAEDIALYIYTYGHLPNNFMTKKEAQSLGWPGGSLEPYAPGMCIGGDYFGNMEGLLPTKKGRNYHECDVNTLGARSRGAERIIYSNDGLIYYTNDHYESFTLLYGVE